MSEITYPAKTVAGDGGNSYIEGNTIPATELQADFNAVATIVNGQLDEDNLKTGTQIPNSKLVDIDGTKVSDHSDSAAIAAQTTTPGDSSTMGSNLATDNEGELERLRYQIHHNNRYATNAEYMNNVGAMTALTWAEPPIQGPNLVRNSGFEQFSGSTGDPPDGWTEIGTLATSGIESAAVAITGTHKRSFAITTDAANDGISQTFEGLRASTKYLFGVKYFRTAGTVSFSTTGALGGGNHYQNVSASDNSTTGTQINQYVVKSDGSGSDITIQIEGTTATDFNLVEVWFHELNDDSPLVVPHIPSQSAVHNTQDLIPSNSNFSTATSATFWESVAELDLEQYVPTPGYQSIEYSAHIAWKNNNHGAGGVTSANHSWRLLMDDGSGDVTVDGPYLFIEAVPGVLSGDFSKFVVLRHVVDNPEPGKTYSFTVQGGAFNDGSTNVNMSVNYDDTAVSGEQGVSRSRLEIKRI